MSICFISLGSNISPEIDFLLESVDKLSSLDKIDILNISSLYISEPVGYKEQKPFYNCVLKLKTGLTPRQLLKATQKIENLLFRKREIKWGPRTIDIDILLYESIIIKTRELTIPHKELLKRNFILEPLLEIEKDIIYPGTNKEINKLTDPEVKKQKVRILKDDRWIDVKL